MKAVLVPPNSNPTSAESNIGATSQALVEPNTTLFESQNHEHQESTTCNNCEQQQATIDCPVCVALYCGPCFALTHCNPIMRRHQQIPVRCITPPTQESKD
eukprot:c18986_g1_i1.p1 GENE.c18986_g1_i1~~c18986_g1_i1.p1  ORF type:complete len:101 (+),score=14.26 c18986_g1_i1:62-364(+)